MSDEVAHHTDVRRQETVKYVISRSSGYWGKEYVLTWGDLELYELQFEKSAEVIVVESYEPEKKNWRSHNSMKNQTLSSSKRWKERSDSYQE